MDYDAFKKSINGTELHRRLIDLVDAVEPESDFAFENKLTTLVFQEEIKKKTKPLQQNNRKGGHGRWR